MAYPVWSRTDDRGLARFVTGDVWLLPVTAGVVRDGLLTALRTSIEMATQRCRAAVLDGAKCFELLVSDARPERSRRTPVLTGWLLLHPSRLSAVFDRRVGAGGRERSN
jgi:hypothetical protein